MRRRTWIAFCAALPACRRRVVALDPFPETVGPWRRASLRDIPASQFPDAVPPTAVERVQEAVYEGPGKLTARAYLLTTPESALDLSQRWRPAPDTIFFWSNRYFILVNWQQSDRKSLQQFTSALSKRLNTE